MQGDPDHIHWDMHNRTVPRTGLTWEGWGLGWKRRMMGKALWVEMNHDFGNFPAHSVLPDPHAVQLPLRRNPHGGGLT